MARLNHSNTAVRTSLSSAISDTDTSLDVNDASGYPSTPFAIEIGDEVIKVDSKSGTTFSSLNRGYDGTTAASHASGSAVNHVAIKEDFEEAYNLLDTVTNAAGDLATGDGSSVQTLSVGSDGQLLGAASGQSVGLQWQNRPLEELARVDDFSGGSTADLSGNSSATDIYLVRFANVNTGDGNGFDLVFLESGSPVTTNDYDWQTIEGDGTTASASNGSGNDRWSIAPGSGSDDSYYGSITLHKTGPGITWGCGGDGAFVSGGGKYTASYTQSDFDGVRFVTSGSTNFNSGEAVLYAVHG